jgi:hypothetical protein
MVQLDAPRHVSKHGLIRFKQASWHASKQALLLLRCI